MSAIEGSTRRAPSLTVAVSREIYSGKPSSAAQLTAATDSRRCSVSPTGRPAALALVLAAAAGVTLGEPSGTSVFNPASTPASDIQNYTFFVFGITGAMFVTVFTLLVIAIVRFRRRPGDDTAEPPQIYGSDQVEIAWTVIPILIVLVLGLTTARTVFQIQGPAAPA